MRQIGELKEQQLGQRFLNFMHNQGIACELREDDDSSFTLWVINEDQLDQASATFEEYLRDPRNSRFDAPTIDQNSSKQPSAASSEFIDVRRQIFSRSNHSQITLTISLIVLSILATMLTNSVAMADAVRFLYFSEFYGQHFPEITSGQLWRLITPIFIHSGLLHLAFNMMWLFQLGGMMERLEGKRTLLVMLLTLATLCNVAQYLVSGPLFGGMSGVIYGLLGYIWMMTRYSSKSYNLQQQTVVFMVIWMVVCLVGLVPNVANTQHVVGFVSGILFGFLRSGGIKTWRRRQDFRKKFD